MAITLKRAEEIIEQVFSCKPLKDIIPTSRERVLFYEMLAQNAAKANAYSRAQTVRAEIIADEVVEIADNDPDAQRARNRIMARQWHAGKLSPKYSDRIELNVNQTIDIGGALADATRRAMLPACYPEKRVESEVVETIENKSDGSTGSQPDIDIYS